MSHKHHSGRQSGDFWESPFPEKATIDRAQQRHHGDGVRFAMQAIARQLQQKSLRGGDFDDHFKAAA